MTVITIYKNIEMYIYINLNICKLKKRRVWNDMIVFYIVKYDLSILKGKVVDRTIEGDG